MTSITWTGTGDDQTAVAGDYTLRVEQMDKDIWWWQVYHNDEELVPHGSIWEGDGKTRKSAKLRAITAMKKHKKKTS